MATRSCLESKEAPLANCGTHQWQLKDPVSGQAFRNRFSYKSIRRRSACTVSLRMYLRWFASEDTIYSRRRALQPPNAQISVLLKKTLFPANWTQSVDNWRQNNASGELCKVLEKSLLGEEQSGSLATGWFKPDPHFRSTLKNIEN